jgi:hypothetical protein
MVDRYGKYFALVLVLASVGYGLYQARMLIQGPMLTVYAPREGVTEMGQLMEVRGKVENVTRVRVNGRTITTDPEGVFSELLVTPDGYGVVLVEAEDRFGYRTAQQIEVFGMPHGVIGPQEETREEEKEEEEEEEGSRIDTKAQE